MNWARLALASLICSSVAGNALGQNTNEVAPNQVTLTGEVKYMRVDPEITYMQIVTTDRLGNVVEWELERPTIDKRPYRRSVPQPSAIKTGDIVSVEIAPSSPDEPKGQVLSASKIEPVRAP